MASTWACNLRCSYCFVDGRGLSGAAAAMSRAMAERLLDALDAGLSHVESICVHLYGGEPLLNFAALEALAARAANYPPERFSFAITTNGVCLSDRALELLDAGAFAVVLSLDGPPEVHDRCRRTAAGEPTHTRVMACLEALRARTRCLVRGSSVVRRGWRLREAQAYLRSLPVDCIKAQPVRALGPIPEALTRADYAAYHEDLEALGDQVIDEIERETAPRDDRFNARVLRLLAGEGGTTFCGAGDASFGVLPGGEVLPCVLLPAEGNRLGHIDDEGAGWVEAGRRWAEARPLRAECRGCAELGLCGGGCPALMPVCAESECVLNQWTCEIARRIYGHFRAAPERLLILAGA